MGENSAISWTDHTMNFWIGCTKVSPACTNCYAAVDTFARRERANGRELWGPKADRHRTSEALWKKPYQWNRNHQWLECPECHSRGMMKDAFADGRCFSCQVKCVPTRQRVFVSSLSDICEEHPHITDDMRREVAQIVMDCKNLDWLWLTKRPENFNRLWLDLFGGKVPDNLWIGTTVENQEYAEKRIPELIRIRAKTRFLSCEPLLGHIDLHSAYMKYPGAVAGQLDDYIHWVITGGESGSKARPMHPNWARSLRDQCSFYDIPFHFKQWGEWAPWDMNYGAIKGYLNAYAERDGTFSDMPSGTQMTMCRVGKKTAGRLLDGEEHNGFPVTQ